MPQKLTLAVIIGNRDFFPDQLVTEARRDLDRLFKEEDIEAVLVGETDTKLGGVETYAEAETCAALFRENQHRIDGVLVCLPNFGDEQGVADTLRLSGLNVPVLVQAYPDDLDKLSPALRRDGFCGKISVCNNLVQRGIRFTLTSEHTVHPLSDSFREDLRRFAAVCRLVRGLRTVRLGAVGARPGAFNTVRYSEKILERAGIPVTTVDLSEILGRAEKIGPDAKEVGETIDRISAYAPVDGVPREKLVQMARLDLVLRSWMQENRIDATAIQCWTSLQQNWGCNVCTSMSMMSEHFMPSACEVDVTGVLTMYAMQLASGSPSALVDWNNNYGGDPEKCVLFHCGNWAKHFQPKGRVANAPILGSTLGVENTYGAMEGRTPAAPLTFGRLTTDDTHGRIRAYVGEGELTDDPLETFGNRAVARVHNLNQLMHYVCRHGFEHHVVMNLSKTADVLAEGFAYLGWETHVHR
ncbi:MAG: fucose isomerase [Puniceicoccaceae bacterium]|nr:MAG: fucose isomerase [Puniceicoccaceae bacterium]